MKDFPLAVHSPAITYENEPLILDKMLKNQFSNSKIESFPSPQLKNLVSETRKPGALLQEQLAAIEQRGNEDAFYVGDLGEVVRQHIQWHQKLPSVHPYY
ncbi:hypothetical protein HMI55_005058, partial [Coelomomyces lativittatus]